MGILVSDEIYLASITERIYTDVYTGVRREIPHVYYSTHLYRRVYWCQTRNTSRLLQYASIPTGILVSADTYLTSITVRIYTDGYTGVRWEIPHVYYSTHLFRRVFWCLTRNTSRLLQYASIPTGILVSDEKYLTSLTVRIYTDVYTGVRREIPRVCYSTHLYRRVYWCPTRNTSRLLQYASIPTGILVSDEKYLTSITVRIYTDGYTGVRWEIPHVYYSTHLFRRVFWCLTRNTSRLLQYASIPTGILVSDEKYLTSITVRIYTDGYTGVRREIPHVYYSTHLYRRVYWCPTRNTSRLLQYASIPMEERDVAPW